MITKAYNLDKATYSIYGESALGILNLYKSGNPVTTTTVNLGNGGFNYYYPFQNYWRCYYGYR